MTCGECALFRPIPEGEREAYQWAEGTCMAQITGVPCGLPTIRSAGTRCRYARPIPPTPGASPRPDEHKE